MQAIRGTILVVAMLATAMAISACRREVPQPNGLGMKVPAQTQVAQ